MVTNEKGRLLSQPTLFSSASMAETSHINSRNTLHSCLLLGNRVNAVEMSKWNLQVPMQGSAVLLVALELQTSFPI